MVLGLRTVIYPAPDLARGKDWYAQVLGRGRTSTSRSTLGLRWAGLSSG